MADAINGLFEAIGAAMVFLNIQTLMRDRCVKGVHWGPTAFFTAWGYWNTIYYPSLGQWWSLAGGMALALANTIWVLLAWKYRRGRP